MRRAWLLIILAAALVLGIVVSRQLGRSRDPSIILQQLRSGKGDQTKLMMRLQLSRGDVIAPMIEQVLDEEAPSPFRCQIIESLSRQFNRSSDERIVDAFMQVRRDSDVMVRRTVIEGFSVFGGVEQHVRLIDQFDDNDAEVRRTLYSMFTNIAWNEDIVGGVWAHLEPDQKLALLDFASRAATEEQDPELKFFARSIVGREIAILCRDATKARESADLTAAVELLQRAMALDPTSQRVQVRTARHYLAIDEVSRALDFAEQNGALLRIPQLSEAPVIDGDATENAWDSAFSSDRFYLTIPKLASKKPECKTTFSIGHRDGRIYVAVIAIEPELHKLHVASTERDGRLWLDDCVELFFDPMADGMRAYQFIINAAGALFDTIGQDSKHNFNCDYAAKVFDDRGYWSCEFAIETSELTDDPITAESVWGINIVRARLGAAAEHCQWWPTYGGAHKYDHFPLAVFE